MISNKEFWELRSIDIIKKYNINTISPSLTEIENKFIKNINDKSLLHIFCNFGINTFCLENYTKNIKGLDICSNSINFANRIKKQLESSVIFINEDFFQYETTDRYDVIYASYGVLDWVKDIDFFIDRVHNLLNENGRFIFIEYTSNHFHHHFNKLGNKINYNSYKIDLGLVKKNTTTKSILGGNVTDGFLQEPVIVYAHDTDLFLNKIKNKFKILEYKKYNYINFKVSNQLKIGPNKFRNIGFNETDSMCYSIDVIKK